MSTPGTAWWGDADDMVPRAHAEWFADTCPQMRLELRAGAGHALLTGCWADILSDLCAYPL
ncbi:MAG TPA: hypothetical protein VFJ19_10990 [Nocardioidaceae bacterium]|nr:hypothetical protein [Nocardioidaceae bacterium]